MFFRASYDTTTKVISSAVLILLVATAAATHSIVATGFCSLVLIAAYAWAPSGYSISDGSIVVRRLIGDVRIAVSSIRDVRAATADDLSGRIRLFGSGGLFGYYGIYRTSRLGRSTWYVTNRNHPVVIVSESGTSVLSPDDVKGFLTTLGKPATASLPLIAGHSAGGSGWMKKVVPMVVAGAAAALAAAGMFYAPGPPDYTLTRETLTIHDRFYPVTLTQANVDVGNVREVDFDRDAEWQPVERTNGFGNAHYHSGWFRVSNGKVVRMYRANSKHLVLLPPKGNGAPVLLEMKDPVTFISELRQKWVNGS